MKPTPVTPGNSWDAFQQARLPSRIQWCEEQIERLSKENAELSRLLCEALKAIKLVDQQTDPRLLAGDPRDAGYYRR